jgi:hypothetical protein
LGEVGMKYEGYIKGYKVVYENEYDLSDKCYLGTTYYGVRKCLMVLPPDISQSDFLKGIMVLTMGHVNPKIIKEVYNEAP